MLTDYVSKKKKKKKEIGKGFASIEDSVDVSIQRFEDYIKRAEKQYWKHEDQ